MAGLYALAANRSGCSDAKKAGHSHVARLAHTVALTHLALAARGRQAASDIPIGGSMSGGSGHTYGVSLSFA